MKAQLAAVGIVILLAGVAMAFYGLSTPITQSTTTTTTSTQALVRDTNRVVSPNGFWAMGAANLAKGESVTGSVSIANYTSSDGPIFVYVMDEPTFINWGGCVPCSESSATVNATLSSSGTYSISWIAPAAGSYYFVLDASYYSASSPATFSANGVTTASVPSTQTTPNTTYNYAGVALAVLGALVLAAGLVLGTTAKKTTGP
ncbi:MAG: hypothetical protein KGI38_01645 [Thaumarchaeota archaeon]|nr:hypothetical protein [Nitrososphaerota archaeon]